MKRSQIIFDVIPRIEDFNLSVNGKGINNLDRCVPECVSHQQDRSSDDERLVCDVEADGDVDVEAVRVRQDVRAEATRNLLNVADVDPVFGDLEVLLELEFRNLL